MLLELDWYGEGEVVFKYSLNGSDKAIISFNLLLLFFPFFKFSLIQIRSECIQILTILFWSFFHDWVIFHFDIHSNY